MARRKKLLPADPVAAHIDSLAHDGRGIARVDGKVVMVDGGLPGEDVMIRYTRLHGRHDEARVDTVLRASADRVTPACAHFGMCGGCSLQHMAHARQIEMKQQTLLDSLRHIGGVVPQQVAPPVLGPQWGYRRKARMGARYVRKKGRLLLGFREKRGSLVADLEQCEILDPAVGHRLRELRAVLAGLSIAEQVPQVEIAVGDTSTALVLRHLQPLGGPDLDALQAFAATWGFTLLLQPGGPDSVTTLSGEPAAPLSYRLDGPALEFHFQPTGFTQVNAAINVKLVAQALDWLQPGPADRVLDLFCGAGNFTLPIARLAAHVSGIEGSDALVEQARGNARFNGIENCDFRVADLTAEADGGWPWPGYDKLLLDPPRSGAQAVVERLQAPYPARIVYVSCNPATLARDAGILVARHGYVLRTAGILDMFPHTAHVESMAVFDYP